MVAASRAPGVMARRDGAAGDGVMGDGAAATSRGVRRGASAP
jgi:hypothetical protein